MMSALKEKEGYADSILYFSKGRLTFFVAIIYEWSLTALPFPLPPKEKRNKEGAIPRRETANGKMWHLQPRMMSEWDAVTQNEKSALARIVVAAEPGPGLPAVRHHGHVLRAPRRHPPPLLENLHDGAHKASTN